MKPKFAGAAYNTVQFVEQNMLCLHGELYVRVACKRVATVSPAAKPRFGALPCFEVLSFFLMDSASLGIVDD